jgi:hypothetical protein
MREAFINWNPRADTLEQVRQINAICAEYQRQGYNLTLRQLYYQFVSRDLIPNNQRAYKQLGGVVDLARKAGLVDWNYIEDRTRSAYRTDGIDTSPEDAVRAVADGYQRALWDTQLCHVEVWVEKEALAGIVQQAASEVGVIYFSCRGYVSQSEMYSAGRRFKNHGQNGKTNILIHLGDHDPSGIDMTRDITDRLNMYAGFYSPEVRRIALNMDQVQQYQPPPNPAKMTDSRFESYLAEYGDESWELDALEPQLLHDLIVEEVLKFRDPELWEVARQQQEDERAQLVSISNNWDEIVANGFV